MDMVLTGPNGSALPEFKIAGDYRIKATDMVLPSLEIAGTGGHWVEVSRAICPGEPSVETRQMLEWGGQRSEADARGGALAGRALWIVRPGFEPRGDGHRGRAEGAPAHSALRGGRQHAHFAEAGAEVPHLSSASPLRRQEQQNDPVRTGILIGLGIVLLVFIGSIIAVLMMHAPTL